MTSAGVLQERAESALARRWQRARGDPLVRGSALILFYATATNVILYTFHLALGRMLTPAEFGIASALFALLTLVTRPFEVLELVAAHFVAKARANPGAVAGTVRRLRAVAIISGLVLSTLLLVATPALVAGLRTHWRLQVAVALAAGLVPLFTFYRGLLQGAQRFHSYGWGRLTMALVRLVVGWALVVAGYGVFGAVVGPLAGFAAAILVMSVRLPSSGPSPPGDAPAPQVLRFALPALGAFIGFAALSSVCVLLVRLHFSEHETGLFAAAFLLAEAVLYLPAAVGLVLFPVLSEKRSGSREPALLKKAVLLALTPSLTVVALYAMLGGRILSLVLGAEYEEAGALVPILALAMAFAAVVNVVMQYETALRSFTYPVALIGFAMLQAALITLFHSSLMQVALVIASVCGLAAMTGLWLALRPISQQKT